MKQSLSVLALLFALLLMLSACAGKGPNADADYTPDVSSSQAANENNDTPAQNEGNAQEQGNADEQGDQTNVQSPESNGSYEEYLSALSLFALSMEYPDFQLQDIYAASSVTMANKANSQGIYVFFDSMGESLCARVTPIAAERSESGTLDLFANELGYAAFEIQSEQPDINSLILLEPGVYGQLLPVLSGISLYNH